MVFKRTRNGVYKNTKMCFSKRAIIIKITGQWRYTLMAGIRDVAKEAGVSISTVSNVLNGRSNVGEKTKERVLEVCKQLSYNPAGVGKLSKKNKCSTIVFNFSDFDRRFYFKIIKGISDYINESGYDMIICTDQTCAKFMRNHLSCGCIILDKKMKDSVLLSAARENYPIVVLDRVLENPYIKSVVVNNYGAMRELTRGLIKRGYKKFGFIGGPEYTPDNRERYEGFKDVLEENGIPFYHEDYFSGDFKEKSGYTCGKIMVLSKDLPEVVVCANDNMALGVMKAFKENGLRVPEDVAVTGFDNNILADAMKLTTVHIPNYERGYLAAKYLIENINGKVNADIFTIETKVIWRDSVGNIETKK